MYNHLGMKDTSRATLARVNAEQPATLYHRDMHLDIAMVHICCKKRKSTYS